MSHSKGHSTRSADHAAMSGPSPSTSAYGSSAAATNKAAALYGVGYGDRGYGQTTPVVTNVLSGQPMKAATWADFRTALSNMATFQGTPQTLLPPAAFYAPGSKVQAANPATSPYDIQSMVDSCDANRFNNNGGASLSAVAGALNITRATAWGSGSTGIVCEASITFASENEARFFFNASGSITLALAHAATSMPQDVNWGTLLSTLGTIAISANATTRSGSLGTPNASRGYYQLTTAYQVVYDGSNIGTSVYSANDVLVEACIAGNTGMNGANGNVLKIRVTITDQHTTMYALYSDQCQPGTKATFGYKKAAVGLPQLPAAPAFAQLVVF